MAKRPAADNDDSSDIESYRRSSTPAKRARVSGESEEDDASPEKVRTHVNNAKGKSNMKAVDDDDDDEEEEEAGEGEEDDEGEVELDARLSTNMSRMTAADQDDEEFEAENSARLLQAISKREKKRGVRMRVFILLFYFILAQIFSHVLFIFLTQGIASMGIIESIEMHQFMCHPRLSFNFGPQINFIIGASSRGFDNL